MFKSTSALILVALACQCESFSVSSTRTCLSTYQPSTSTVTQLQASRRESLHQIAFGIGSILLPQQAMAADKEPMTIYKSGKTPIVPDQKPKDKNDTSGTRKDTSVLRSISNCKSQCETVVGSDGYARSKEECLSDCQDICCTTYEQCTFGIVPRI